MCVYIKKKKEKKITSYAISKQFVPITSGTFPESISSTKITKNRNYTIPNVIEFIITVKKKTNP